MPLITTDEIKAKWPNWRTHCNLPDSEHSPDQVLTIVRDAAEVELLEYVTVDEATITDQLEHHLIRIARYHAFQLRHGVTVFERKPQVVADYEASIAMLAAYKDGVFAVPQPADSTATRFTITSKDRRFGTWFI